jgi:2-amino-4-hydroxy-6-hydroxymethyldihydropteridine diphosphokinase
LRSSPASQPRVVVGAVAPAAGADLQREHGPAVSEQWWTPAYVGLGSNLDDPPTQIALGFEALATLPDTRLVLRSRLYRSRPLGPIAQPDFVNAAAGLLTRLPYRDLFASLKGLETRLGRSRPAERWGPRRIDLDLLVYGNERIDEPDLTVPHPGIAERAFVLAPLADFAPELRVPGLGLVRELLAAVGTSGLLGAV